MTFTPGWSVSDAIRSAATPVGSPSVVTSPLAARRWRSIASGMTIEEKTRTSDAAYDLVSVIYHALQGAETCDRYIADADERNDHELAEFFREVQSANCDIAERAQRLLAARL
jgi:hypothetical protein